MKIKKGVIMQGLQLPMRRVLKLADVIYKSYGKELVITSALDGTHSAGSYHYYGYALDLRTRYFKAGYASQVAGELQRVLGDSYTVVLEKTHIHVQFNVE